MHSVLYWTSVTCVAVLWAWAAAYGIFLTMCTDERFERGMLILSVLLNILLVTYVVASC